MNMKPHIHHRKVAAETPLLVFIATFAATLTVVNQKVEQ